MSAMPSRLTTAARPTDMRRGALPTSLLTCAARGPTLAAILPSGIGGGGMSRAPLVAILVCLGAIGAPGSALGAGVRTGPDGPATGDGQWMMPSKDYAATRYSALEQITVGNARSLHPVWTFSTGVLGGHEGQPLVVGDTMYVVTPWPNVLYAFDLTTEGYPLRWKYRPDVSSNAIGVSCCDVVNRGAFYADGKIVYNLLDGHTVAVDASSGRELWKTQIADVGDGETTTMAPLVVKDRVIVGASGGEFGIYGWVRGLDLASGRIVWTARNVGPDAQMLARTGEFKPPYVSGADLGAGSWAGDSWRTGGAPVWGWASYDPVLDPSKQTGASRGNVRGVCPSLEGGVSPSSPAAYSPRTHLFYTSTNNLCMDYAAVHASRLKGTPFVGVTSPYFAGPGGYLGTFMAWDAATGRKVWENKEPFPTWSGALVTAGDVAFYGTLDGWFKWVDAKTGKLLSKFKVGSGVVGNPITYRGPDGRQYVAVYAGIGGDWALLAGDVRSDDPTDVRPPPDYMKNIARHTSQGGMIWIFGL